VRYSPLSVENKGHVKLGMTSLAHPLVHEYSHVLPGHSKDGSSEGGCANEHWIGRIGTRSYLRKMKPGNQDVETKRGSDALPTCIKCQGWESRSTRRRKLRSLPHEPLSHFALLNKDEGQ